MQAKEAMLIDQPFSDTLLRNSPLLEAGCYPTMPDLNATSRLSAEARLEIAQIPAENPCPLSQQAKPPTPDYLRRTKRSPIPSLDGPLQPAPNIRIIDSPVKGRRLALFQATSEESFEESLMAGGYGRYVSPHHPRPASSHSVPSNLALGCTAMEAARKRTTNPHHHGTVVDDRTRKEEEEQTGCLSRCPAGLFLKNSAYSFTGRGMWQSSRHRGCCRAVGFSQTIIL